MQFLRKLTLQFDLEENRFTDVFFGKSIGKKIEFFYRKSLIDANSFYFSININIVVLIASSLFFKYIKSLIIPKHYVILT